MHSTAIASHGASEARKDGNQSVQRQQKDVDAQEPDVNNAVSKKNYDVAIAKADGDYKVALQKCEALSGSEQSACKERAEADHKTSKADAELLKNR